MINQMANNKLKTHALKKILQNPESQIQDEELFRLVKKVTRQIDIRRKNMGAKTSLKP